MEIGLGMTHRTITILFMHALYQSVRVIKSPTVDREIFVVSSQRKFRDLQRKLNTRNILCNVCRPVPILVAKVWRRKLGYAKNLQAKYFTRKNILIYGMYFL